MMPGCVKYRRQTWISEVLGRIGECVKAIILTDLSRESTTLENLLSRETRYFLLSSKSLLHAFQLAVSCCDFTPNKAHSMERKGTHR